MEILKKTSVLILVILSFNCFSQNGEADIKAFSESYTFESEKKYSEAIQSITKIYEESSYEKNIRLGWLYYLSGKYTASISYYDKAIKLLPFSIEARFGYILPSSILGNWESVKHQYTEILKIDPKNSKANYYLGLYYYNKKDFANSYKNFELCANLFPSDYDCSIMFAWTNFQLGKLREAKVLFNKVLLIRPNDNSALEGLKLIK